MSGSCVRRVGGGQRVANGVFQSSLHAFLKRYDRIERPVNLDCLDEIT
ncbi:uncharacterized protein METZ01_LOCUS226389, partial [marine metagenome]